MPRPPKPLDPDRSALHWLGYELRRWRIFRRMLQKELGQRINFSRAYISLVETGEDRPARQFVERCDHALRAGGALLAIFEYVEAEQAGAQLEIPALRAHAPRTELDCADDELPELSGEDEDQPADPRAPAGLATPESRLARDRWDAEVPGAQWPAHLDDARQSAVTLWDQDLVASKIDDQVATATTVVALRWLITPRDASASSDAGWRRVGLADVERLRSVRRRLKGLDNSSGGGAAFPMAVAYLRREVAPLLQGRYDEATGRALLAVTAELKLDVGWMAYDAGDQALASRYMTQALRLSHATDDRLFGGRVLAAMSHQALHLDRVALAVDLAQAARAGTKDVATPKATAMLATMEACAWARDGDANGCQAALGVGEQALSRSSSADAEPDWLDFDEGGLWGHAARAHRDLARFRETKQHARKAARYAERSISLCQASHGRTRAQRNAILATAHLQLGEVDAAAAVGTLIVVDAWQLHSNHVYGEVATLVDAIAPTSAHAAHDFLEQGRDLLVARRAS